METWYYEVVSIDGDYANLKRTDIASDDLKLVARALLPPEIMEGSRLKYELMQYFMVEEGSDIKNKWLVCSIWHAIFSNACLR